MLTLTPVALTHHKLQKQEKIEKIEKIETVETIIEAPKEVPPQPKKRYTKYQITCLAMNVFHEARNQSLDGMKAVAWVTMNRVNGEGYPNTICGVVYQPYQFSWTIDKPKIKNWKKYHEIEAIVVKFLNDHQYNEQDPTNGAKYYHADYIRQPKWAKQFERTAYIGSHIFYRRES